MPRDDASSPRAARPADSDGPVHPSIRWGADVGGDRFWFSSEWAALTGQSANDSAGTGWMACIHPEDRDGLLHGLHRARATGVFGADLRILMQPDGNYGRWRMRASLTQEDPPEWSGTAVDVSDLLTRLTETEALRALLHHRIRNTLATIRSVSRRTAENSTTVEDYRHRFDGRLAAFARAQTHIMRTGVHGVDFEALLADELFANQVGGRARYSGPEVRLSARLADKLGLALHELTDNAMQHGALSRKDGHLDIRWWTAGTVPAPTLHLDWCEELADGGILSPDTEGFGLDLLTRSLRHEVDAKVVLGFTPSGMTCSIALPLG
ncbi:two-component sensor histidine kinase [Sphingomonas insulae]|uniref:histidine kinase n=1 Tax=Sphingomonas insulae TaxID=424800 RepID=A0ABP3SZN1_9SPHN|nr:HWE histidine kinase domain-containing protein [Sphingomonas insulae]NIJ28231.1 two-component sensor histidine kinase [Sphingomonas insulae]